MDEDSGYFSRRSNEFRIPTQYYYNRSSADTKPGFFDRDQEEQQLCCCRHLKNPTFSHPRTRSGCYHEAEDTVPSNICTNNNTTTHLPTPDSPHSCSSSHNCHCVGSCSNYKNTTTTSINKITKNNIKDISCPNNNNNQCNNNQHSCYQHPVVLINKDTPKQCPCCCCCCNLDSEIQKSWKKYKNPHLNNNNNNNNKPSICISPPSSSSSLSSDTSEFISPSSLAYPGSGLTATDSEGIGSRSNSEYLCDNNNTSFSSSTPASSVGYHQSSVSSSNQAGRARFSPYEILKLGYKDLQKYPDLKRFSYGFEDEQDFEDFKQELREFHLSKKGPTRTTEENYDDYDLTPTKTSSGYYSADPTRSYLRNSCVTSSDCDISSTSDEELGRDLRSPSTTSCVRESSHLHRNSSVSNNTSNKNSNWCRVLEKEKKSCDNNNEDNNSTSSAVVAKETEKREVVRNITFSSSNLDRFGRIIGTEFRTNNPNLTSPNYNNESLSPNLSKFSLTSNTCPSADPLFTDHSCISNNNNTPLSFSPLSANKDNQHGPLLLKRHSPRDLSSFQHLSAVPPLRKTSAPHDMLMDFFKSDEHFQEFEREFANLGRDFNVFNRLRRDDDDCDGVRPSVATRGIEPSSSTPGSATPIPIRIDSPRGTELGPSSSGPSRTPIPIHVDYQPGGSCREPTPKTELTAGQTGDGVSIIHPPGNNAGNFFHADDTFLDFFNNDEDFKEFEREFANFKLKRRSRAFADDFNRRSNCDLFADLFPGFEGQSPRERRSRGSASDWDYLFNKIKRNSNIFTDPPRCLPAGESSDEDMPPVFASSHLNDSKTLSPLPPLPPPPYQEQSQQQQQWSSENPNRLSRKAVEIPIQRRPALPASPGRHFSPELCRRSVPKKNPLELKIEHVTSPCSSPTPSTRTPTGAQFVPKPRTDSPLLHINENEVDDSPGPSIRRVLTFLDDSDHDDDDDKADEPTTPTNTGQTVLHIDESCSDNDRDQGGIIIEHRFSEGFASPTTTITRRKKGSVAASSERSASPASPLALRHQLSRQLPSSELRDQQRRYTDPKVVIERRIPGRGSGPDMCKQNRSSTALEFLHDVQEPHRYYNRSNNNDNINNTGNKEQHPPHKDCQYTCHEKCRQLVTLDCKNSLPHSGSDGSIETSLSEPASTPGSNSTISDTSPNCNTDIVSNGEQRLPLGVDVRDQPRESPFQWITKSVREQQPYADLKDLMDWWEWENLQSLYFRHINSQHTLQFTAMLRPQDETDSGYRSGPIPEEILPKKQPSQETLNREDLQRKLQEYNNNVPFANLAMGSESRCSGNMDSGCSMTSNDLGQSGDMEQKSRVKPSSQVDSDPSTSPAHLAESDSDFQDGDGDDDDENNNKDGVFNNHHNESDGETFQGFIKVTLNLIRPITMSLGARPPSIYEVLTREHIVEQNTQSISFYMPRDTVKSIHVDSETTTKEVISALLKKFKILDNPRKFAMYEQELNNGKIVKLRRVLDDEFPLQTCLGWGTENLQAHRLVLQENEATGDIMWSNFSLPELNNFLKVLEREQDEHINQLQYKYRMMKKVILQRLKEIRKCRNDASPTSPSAPTTGSNGNHSPGGHAQKVI